VGCDYYGPSRYTLVSYQCCNEVRGCHSGCACVDCLSCLCSEGGFFNAVLSFATDYPNSPPTCRFTSEMWHPNGELSPGCWPFSFLNTTCLSCALIQCTMMAGCVSPYCIALEMTPMAMRLLQSVGPLCNR